MFGVDLSEWLESGRVRALLDLYEQLPSTSRVFEAMSNDPEWAEDAARQHLANDGQEEWRPRSSDYDLNAQFLSMLIEQVKGLRQTIVAANGGKPEKEKALPGPRNLTDAFVEALQEEEDNAFYASLGYGPGALN